jgi:Polysaccharide lyase
MIFALKCASVFACGPVMQPAPVPDVSAFNPASGSTIYVDNHSFGVANANRSYSVTKPDTQTLAFEVHSGDHWSADLSQHPTNTPERSEIDGYKILYPSGTPVEVSYNFTMGAGAANTSSGITVGQFHNNDLYSSPPFEIALQPGEKMTIYLGWLPTISGTAQVGQTLKATTGTWTHNPTSFTYQWNRAGTAIGGATASAYVPVAADVGNMLTVSVVATNSGGSSTPATSAATSAVIAASSGVPVDTALPTISGTAQVGQTLTATNGTWANSPTSFTYQWQSAAPTPDVTSFNAAGTVIVGGNSYAAESAYQPWSLTNPDTQTLVFQVRPGDQWSADVGRTGAPNRSEIDGSAQMFTPGTEINISYNFDMTSSTARTDAAGITIGQMHNNDTQLGGATSPTFEIDLQPLDFMSIYVGYLTASGQPTNSTFYGTQVVNGISTSYAQVYADPNPIVRNHNYTMQIQIKFTSPGDNSGFVNIWRDGVQIVHSTGQLGFGFNNYWKNGIYGTVTNATQIAQYQNLMVAARPLVLGTGSTYVPVSGDTGNAITCTVTATNSFGSASATSAATGVVS